MSIKQPPELKMYGYCVAWRQKPQTGQRDPRKLPLWQIEQCDEYLNLPAHYTALDEAMDRADHMRSRGVDARVVALVAEPTDTPEEFDRNRIHE
jgi:hypothetical protein